MLPNTTFQFDKSWIITHTKENLIKDFLSNSEIAKPQCWRRVFECFGITCSFFFPGEKQYLTPFSILSLLAKVSECDSEVWLSFTETIYGNEVLFDSK